MIFAFLMTLLIQPASVAISSGEVDAPSAMRLPNQNWEQALNHQLSAALQGDPNSARAVARPYREGFETSAIPIWPGTYEELRNALAETRDARLYIHDQQPNFIRRSTWLYPVDGCYARAEHISLGFESRGLLRPGKVLAFGNLKFSSTFGPRGTVYWSYHIAAAFRIANEIYVLDPVANPVEPLQFADWLRAMSGSIDALKVSICGAETYTPASRCVGGTRVAFDTFTRHQKSYLEPEWNRLLKAQLNPLKVLGDEPPWATPQDD